MTTDEMISYLEDEIESLEDIEAYFTSEDTDDCPENEELLDNTVRELAVRRASVSALEYYKENAHWTENVSALHPSDGFICSRCGIKLEGWQKVIGDVSNDTCAFEEFSFKYCPNCGSEIIEL